MRKHERIVQYFSLGTIVITSGLFSSLPFFDYARIEKPVLTQNLAEVCRTEVTENQWKYIVIHHSATEKGNAARFDEYHRKKRGWEYGLAYHFVIGNGTLSGDGE